MIIRTMIRLILAENDYCIKRNLYDDVDSRSSVINTKCKIPWLSWSFIFLPPS